MRTLTPFRKIAILGANSVIGKPLTIWMNLLPLVKKLSLFDISGATKSIHEDVVQISSRPNKVEEHSKKNQINDALTGSDLVIILPDNGMTTRDEMERVRYYCTHISDHCPKALINIISPSSDTVVPAAAEVLKKAGCYDPRRLFGMTELGVVGAQTFYAEKLGTFPEETEVTVVGGRAGSTILPLFSQALPEAELTEEEVHNLTMMIQQNATHLVKARDGSGVLSTSYAGAIFANACLKGLNGVKEVVNCTYVQSTIVPELPFFASKVKLGENGVEKIMPLGKLSVYEENALKTVIPQLRQSIDEGVEYGSKN